MIAVPLIIAGALIAPSAAAAAPSSTGSALTTSTGSTGLAPDSSVQVPNAVAASFGSCPLKYLCFWVDAGPAGAMGKVMGDNVNWTDFPQSTCKHGNWNDCASALYNHGQFDAVTVFQDINMQGGSRCLILGTMWANLTQHTFVNGVNMNDAITSNQWRTSNSCG
jgi:hypothetical protein